jgi:TonB-linked SusC/RagA family outer membrane protein
MAVVRNFCRAAAAIAFLALPLTAQDVGNIHGSVVDSATKQPLANVNVFVDGTPRGAVSRLDGAFDISGVPAGSHTVRARRIGYHTTTTPAAVTAGGTATIEVSMAPQPAVLTEMVVTGYGAQRREAITSSIATVESKDANVGVITNPTQLIQGRATGVQVVQSSGEPGANTQIRIRGGTSISASNDPLYVIDGVPVQNDATAPDQLNLAAGSQLSRNPLNSINPNDIESMTILKDASATAIYGSRGANGVILITTKRGQRDAQVEYETYIGEASRTRSIGLANGAQYRAAVTKYQADLGGAAAVAALGPANTDWEKALSRTAYTMSHNLAFTGGSAQTKYRASLNYFDQDGVILANSLRRYQGRLNATHDAIGGRLRLALNMTTSRVNNQYAPNENTGGFLGSLFTNMVIFNPTRPVHNADGTFYEVGTGAQDVRNPVALAEQISDVSPENRLLGNFSATVGVLDNLTAQTTIGADNTNAVRRTYFPRVSPLGANYNGYGRQAERSLQTLNFQQLLTYSPRMGNSHELEVVGGYEYVKDNNSEFGSASTDFITDAFGVDNLNAGKSVPPGFPYSWHTEDALASFFTRANYGYAGKYFVTAVVRTDGSSRLAPRHQWATFPGLSASWRMSEENFMRSHPLGLSSLALRAGWGEQGNQAIKPYQTKLLLRSDANSLYPFNGVITSGLAAAQVGDSTLKWETAAQTNLGVDYGFMNDRVTGTVEIYQKDTKDLLLDRPVPQPAVVATRIENVGGVRNRGLEASADMQLWTAPSRSLSGGLVLTVERNKVTSLGDSKAICADSRLTSDFGLYSAAKCTFIQSGFVSGQGQSGVWSEVIMKGQPIGTFLAPSFIGVKNGQQFFACHKDPRQVVVGTDTASLGVSAGCVNGETTTPQDADRVIVGTANPSFTMGVHNNATWSAFDVSWLWRGEFGGKVFNNTALVYQTKSAMAQGRNFLEAAMSDPDSLHESARYSSRWIENRTFVRLQNLTVGYALPARVTRGKATRVYLSADNLLLLTGYKGYDPEVFTSSGLASRGIDYLSYPSARTITVGARTTF